jgi:hypothetical protein
VEVAPLAAATNVSQRVRDALTPVGKSANNHKHFLCSNNKILKLALKIY